MTFQKAHNKTVQGGSHLLSYVCESQVIYGRLGQAEEGKATTVIPRGPSFRTCHIVCVCVSG